MNLNKVLTKGAIAFVMCAAAASACGYVTNTWKGVSGRWRDAENWNGGVPSADDVASFPRSKTGYTVTIDDDVACRYIRNEGGTSGGRITFSGGGSLTCSGKAAGPTVSGCLSSGSEVAFANITANLGAFNPNNGNLIVEDGAVVTMGVMFYMNGVDSTLTVNGGEVALADTSFRTKCAINVNAGHLIFTKVPNFRHDSVDRPVKVAQTGGVIVLNGLPTNFSAATIDLTGGELRWPDSSFSAITYAAWLPKQGGRLVLTHNEYKALTTELRYDYTVPLDGAIYITNNLDKCTPDTVSSTPGVYAYTNTTFSGKGELYANYIFVRGTCTVDIAKLCLGRRMHFTNSKCVMMVPNGVTFGAYGDWTSAYNSAYSYFFGPIAVDTADCFDGVTPRCITFGRTVLDSDVEYSVSGTGTNALWTGESASRIASLSVGPGATFDFKGCYDHAAIGSLKADRLTVGSGATVVVDAEWSQISAVETDIAEDVKIIANVSSDIAAGVFHPVLTDGGTNNLLDQVELAGEGVSGWAAKNVAGVLYLTDGNVAAATYDDKPYGWTGGVDGNFSGNGNWSGGTAPTSSNNDTPDSSAARSLYFGMAAQNVITNDISDASFNNGFAACNMRFLPSAGPYEVYGNTITLYSKAFSNENSPIASESAFPVVFHAPVRRGGSGTFGMYLSGGSYVQFMGEVMSSGAYLFEKGDVRFGGKATFSGLYFGTPNAGNPDVVSVLDGGHMYIAQYNYALRASSYAAPSATLAVRSGGVFACGGNWAAGRATKVNYVIDGNFSVSNTLYSMQNMPFSGNGAVYLGGVAPSNATVRAEFSGGIRLEMGGDWQAVSARCPNTPFTLAVKSGNLTLAAAKNWSYGIPSGVESATSAADRAITVADGATLTFGATGFTTTLRDPVCADGGAIVFENGCRMAFGGGLLASMRSRAGGWTTFATAASVTGMPALSDAYEFRVVDDGDGTVSVQARVRVGSVFVVR